MNQHAKGLVPQAVMARGLAFPAISVSRPTVEKVAIVRLASVVFYHTQYGASRSLTNSRVCFILGQMNILTMVIKRFKELVEEFQLVVAGRNNLLDTVIPPLVFFIVDAFFGLRYAIISAIIIAVLTALLRLSRRQSLLYALGGVAGVGIAVVFSWLFGGDEGFFLPALITGLATVIIAVVSVLVGKPMVAWTSFLARGWPLQWYWHPQVRPAYNEVTVGWAIFFAIRLAYEYDLLSRAPTLLSLINFILGWPAMVVLLAISYLYGLWRLQNLKGPSVEEFKNGAPPPWQGQRRGF